MTACRLLVCERSGDWASALRECVGSGQPRIVETRSFAGCEDELKQSPASLVAIETTELNLEAAVDFIARIHEHFPRAAVVAMVAAPARGAADMLREAGAIEVVSSVLELPSIARIARRHHANAPKQEAALHDFVAELMPWPAHASAQEPFNHG